MKIPFDFFNKNDFDTLIIDINFKTCEDLINLISKKYQERKDLISIFENNKKINYKFSDWRLNSNYIITIDFNFINIIIRINDKTIKLPQLDINTKILEIKNVLSIEDDIFLLNDKLDDNYTLNYYNIKDNMILHTNYQADTVAPIV